MESALEQLARHLPDVLNHNLETVPRLYRQARPGAGYAHSLTLLKTFKARHPEVLPKSGVLVGLGEEDEEILAVLADLRAHNVDMLTVGQYLQPTRHHLPVARYVEPTQFERYAAAAREMGFRHAACGPMVRSSYEADRQAREAGVTPSAD
jgi:lipoic acid synthetase